MSFFSPSSYPSSSDFIRSIDSNKKDSTRPILNRGTLSEKIGVVVAKSFSFLFHSIESSSKFLMNHVISPLFTNALVPLVKNIAHEAVKKCINSKGLFENFNFFLKNYHVVKFYPRLKGLGFIDQTYFC